MKKELEFSFINKMLTKDFFNKSIELEKHVHKIALLDKETKQFKLK